MRQEKGQRPGEERNFRLVRKAIDLRDAGGPAKRPFRGRLRVVGGGVQCPFGLIDPEVPGVAVDQAAAGAGRVRRESAREDPDAFCAQGPEAAAERGTGGEGSHG